MRIPRSTLQLGSNRVCRHVQALSDVLPVIAQRKVGKGGYMVLRPDSGDPVEAVLMALEAGEKVFGVEVNSLGYKTPKGAPHWSLRQGLFACPVCAVSSRPRLLHDILVMLLSMRRLGRYSRRRYQHPHPCQDHGRCLGQGLQRRGEQLDRDEL